MNSDFEWGSVKDSRGHSRLTVEEVEGKLAAGLAPVSPRPAYLAQSRARLLAEAGQPQPPANLIQFVFWGAAGVLTSVVLVVTGGRALASLIKSRHLAKSLGQPLEGGAAAPLTPAAS